MSRRSALSIDQLGFTFDPPSPARAEADLAGIDRMVAATVSRALKDDRRSRDEVAGAMASLLGEDCSRFMLDGYASEARDNFNISVGRFLALIAATERFDLLDRLTRRVGASVLVGEEIALADVADLECRIRDMTAVLVDKRKRLKASTQRRGK